MASGQGQQSGQAYASMSAYGMYPQQMGQQPGMQQQQPQQYQSYGQQPYTSQGAPMAQQPMQGQPMQMQGRPMQQPMPMQGQQMYQTAPMAYPQQMYTSYGSPQQQQYGSGAYPQQYPSQAYGTMPAPQAYGQPMQGQPMQGQPMQGVVQGRPLPTQQWGFGSPVSKAPPGTVQFQFRGRKLDSKDLFSHSDPFLVISALQNPNTTRPTRSNGVWKKIHQTEVVQNNNNPIWKEFSIRMADLCGGDVSRPILIECYDYDSITSNDYIGHCVVSVVELQGESSHKLRNKKRVGISRTAGELHVLKCQILP